MDFYRGQRKASRPLVDNDLYATGLLHTGRYGADGATGSGLFAVRAHFGADCYRCVHPFHPATQR